MTDRFDAIVVGGGAGSTAAYRMATAGLSVLLLERGEFPGSKNISGAVFYGDILNSLLPGFALEAPVERRINNHIISILTGDSSISLKFSHREDNPINISVLRGKFNRWLARKAEEAGAMVINAALVEDLITKEGRVIGVKVGREQGEIFADIVIIAEGANSLLTEKAGLRRGLKPQYLGLGVKELIRLPASEIEKRFQLSANEGAAFSFVGDITAGIPGGAFLYTNRDCLSLGVVAHLNALKKAKLTPYDLLDRFKQHPAVAPLIADGVVKEYSAHLIPEGGYDAVTQIYGDGVMVAGDAAGFTMNYGIVLRGMDFAVASGIAAADAACQAYTSHDFSKHSLSYYQILLQQSFVLQDMRKYRKLSRFLQTERIYSEYPAWLGRVTQQLFTVNARPKDKILNILRREKPPKVSPLTIIADFMRGIKDL